MAEGSIETIFQNSELPAAFLSLGLVAIVMLAFLAILLVIALYIYTSIAYSKIAKKKKYPSPGIAWIPVVGPAIVTSNIAKMHWWPILLMIGFFIPYLSFVCWIIFTVFYTIWNWKMLESFKMPGWISILFIIPLAGLVLHLIIIGMLAWGNYK